MCDDHKNWIAVDQQVTSPDFQALSLAIQGLAVTHHWLRKMEYELVMNGIVEEHDPELYQSYQRTSAANLRQAEIQPTFYFAMYWVKSLADVVAVIRNGRGVRDGVVYKKRLNGLAKTLNIIRQPLAEHQIAEASELLFPLPILILGHDNCIGWRVLDKKGGGTYVLKSLLGRAFHQRCIGDVDQLLVSEELCRERRCRRPDQSCFAG